MKKIVFAFALVLIAIGCSNKENVMALSGNVKGLKKGTIILQKFEADSLVSVDSLLVDGDSNFIFSEEIKSPEMYFLYLRLKDGTLLDDRIAFFAEAGNISIETTLKSFSLDAKISGSENHDKLKDFQKIMARYSEKDLELIEQQFKATFNNNDSLSAEIENSQNKVNGSRYLAIINYAINNNDFEVAPYLMLSQASNANVKYLDTVYNALQPKIKDSKYGKQLESFIVERKNLELDTIGR